MRRSSLFVCAFGSAFLLGTLVSAAATPSENSGDTKHPGSKKVFAEVAAAADPFADNLPEPKKAANAAKKPAQPPVFRTGVRAVEATLAEATSVEFVETPIKDVIEYLRDLHHVEIYLDSPAMREAGVDENNPVTLTLKGLPLDKVLSLMLDSVHLKWTVHNDLLCVTTPEKWDSEDFAETRVYDVADFVAYLDENGKKFDDYAPLINMICSTIDTKSWVDNGGTHSINGESLGTAKVLVVNTRFDVHKRIAALLDEIHVVANKKSGGDMLPRREPPRPVRGGRAGAFRERVLTPASSNAAGTAGPR
jgi:hypothetical protein